MQFILMLTTGQIAGSPGPQDESRPEHLEKISKIKKAGKFPLRGAILDEKGT